MLKLHRPYAHEPHRRLGGAPRRRLHHVPPEGAAGRRRRTPASPALSASATPPPVPPLSPGARIEDERNTIAVFRSGRAVDRVRHADARGRGLLRGHRAGGAGRLGLGLRVGRPGHDRHELPRRRGRPSRSRVTFHDQQTLRGEGRRRRAAQGHRGPQGRRAGEAARPDPRREGRAARGRSEGDRDRQPVRPRSHAHDRRDQRARPAGAGRGRRHDPRHDPDRRRDQSRATPAGRCSTRPGSSSA